MKPDNATYVAWILRSLRCALLCVALALCGCTTHDRDDGTPVRVDIPAAWSGADASPGTPVDATRWWLNFNDPLLTLLVDDALAHSPDLRSARAALDQARAARTSTRSGWFPELSAGATAQRNTTGGNTSDRYAAGIDASWEPDLFGRTRLGADAADEDVTASAATLDATRLALAAEVALAYVELRSRQSRRDIAARSLGTQDETFALTGWRAEAGLASSLDTEQARANREQTRAQLAAQDAALAAAEHRVAVLCGKPPAALHELLAPRQAVPRTEFAAQAGIPAERLRQRPDVRAAEARLRADAARVGARRAARLPALQISGSLGVAAATAGGLTDAGAGTRALLAGITLPLFDAGRRRAEVAAQLAVREQSLAALESTLLAAMEDVENALVAVRTSRERVAALRAAAEAADNAALLARQRYAAGAIDFQLLLDSERTALSVADGLAAAHADEAAAHIRLFKALGSGLPTDDATAEAP